MTRTLALLSDASGRKLALAIFELPEDPNDDLPPSSISSIKNHSPKTDARSIDWAQAKVMVLGSIEAIELK